MKEHGGKAKEFFGKLRRFCGWGVGVKGESKTFFADSCQAGTKLAGWPASSKAVVPSRLVIKGFVLAFLFTVVILAGLVWYTWRSNRHLKAMEITHFRLLQLSGQIVHIDEVLTMSANMAVETGEGYWEERYRKFEPQLDSAIKEVIELSPEEFMKEAISRTDIANIELVAMENQAFDLVRRGEMETASKLLHSKEYTKQKQIYSNGINAICDAIGIRERARIKNEQLIAITTIVFLIFTIPLVVFIWFSALRVLRRYINERKQTELALRNSEQRFRAIADYSYFWEVWVSPGGNPVWTNPAVERVTGYSVEELMAMRDYPMSLVYEADREKFDKAFESALKGSTGSEMVFRLLRKDGSMIWAESSWQPIFDEKGVSQGHRVSIRDITDRKRAEDSLHAEKQLSEDYINSLPGLFYVFDEQRFIRWNKEWGKVTGYSDEELAIKYGTDFFEGNDRSLIGERMQDVFRDGFSDAEAELVTKDGRRIPYYFTGLRNKINGKDHLVGLGIDVTNRKQDELALRKSEERYRSLVDNIDLGITLIDADHNIVMTNSAVGRLFNCDESELVGKKCYNKFEKRQEVCPHCPGEKAMKRGQTNEVETDGVRDDGSRFTVHIKAFPLFDVNGKSAGFIEVVEDITERKMTERALQMIVEASSAAVGPQFFRSLVKSLSFALGLKYAFVGELTGKEPSSVQTLAVWADNDFADNFEYGLAGTPCDNVVTKKKCFHASNAMERFPKDTLIQELGVESYFGVPLFDSAGEPLGLLTVMHNKAIEDISKVEAILKIFAARASAELERIRAELKVANIAKFPDENPYPVFRISGDGSILYNNDAASTLLDISQCRDAGLVRKHLHEYVSKTIKLSEPLQSELTCGGQVYSLTFAPVAEGGYVNVYGLDITERKEGEQALKKSRERLSLALFAANDGLWDWNIKTGELYFSPRYYTMLGYKPDEFAPSFEAWANLIHPDEKEIAVKRVYEHIERKSGSFAEESRLRTKTGDWRWILSRGKVVERDANGKPVRMVGTHSDITDRKLAEQGRRRLNKELEVKNKELESILYAASHDLKSPLVNIQGFGYELSQSCDLIRSSLVGKGEAGGLEKPVEVILNKDIPNALDFIVASTMKMDLLLSGLLDLSRLNSAATNVKVIDMNAIMANVAASMEYQIQESAAKVDIEPLPPCVGDPVQISRVFTNLLDNALKFLDASRPGQIRVSCSVHGNEGIYCVEDNGTGIASEHLEKIFRMFYQHEPDKGAGEGIGLTIVRRIIEKHDGKIWVESEPGKGSKFFVSLPSA